MHLVHMGHTIDWAAIGAFILLLHLPLLLLLLAGWLASTLSSREFEFESQAAKRYTLHGRAERSEEGEHHTELPKQLRHKVENEIGLQREKIEEVASAHQCSPIALARPNLRNHIGLTPESAVTR